jgi:hypothetical protein
VDVIVVVALVVAVAADGETGPAPYCGAGRSAAMKVGGSAVGSNGRPGGPSAVKGRTAGGGSRMSAALLWLVVVIVVDSCQSVKVVVYPMHSVKVSLADANCIWCHSAVGPRIV